MRCSGSERSLQGAEVAAALTRAIDERGSAPQSITVDNGSEFTGRALKVWAIQHGVQLCFIRTGRPVDNPYVAYCISLDSCGKMWVFWPARQFQGK